MKRLPLLALLFLTLPFIAADARCCDAPTITTQPQSQYVHSGESTTLSVQAIGSGTLNYQWYVGPSGTTTTPTGTNSAILNTGPIIISTQFWVSVTSSGCGISAHSVTATVTISRQ